MDWIDADGASFLGLLEAGLIHPGTQLRQEDGKVLLVGDVNLNGGTCSCCPIKGGRIVAYRRVWEPDPEDE